MKAVSSLIIKPTERKNVMNTLMKVFVWTCILFCPVHLFAQAGSYKSIGDGWTKTGGMCSLGDKLYIISSEKLYQTTITGKYTALGGGWSNIGGMCALDEHLYIISNGTIYKTSVK